MPKIQYIEKRFNAATLAVIAQANAIINEYATDGLRLTLRQLYYQFVARGLIPNRQKEYKRVGNIISDARLAGLVDWDVIEDRTRNLAGNTHWRDPGHIIQAAHRSFQMDRWAEQPYRVEVWIEKEALAGVIAGICYDLDVPFFACRGYVSQSEMWAGAMRMRVHRENEQTPVIIHLGDHDPSGIDMTRDIEDRHGTFFANTYVKRIALNFDQIEEYSPPPNPAKLSDSRATAYIREYGMDSWELDVLEPRVLRDLVRDTVEDYRDPELYQRALEREGAYRRVLARVEEGWRRFEEK